MGAPDSPGRLLAGSDAPGADSARAPLKFQLLRSPQLRLSVASVFDSASIPIAIDALKDDYECQRRRFSLFGQQKIQNATNR